MILHIVLAPPFCCLSSNNTAGKSLIYQILDVKTICFHEHLPELDLSPCQCTAQYKLGNGNKLFSPGIKARCVLLRTPV